MKVARFVLKIVAAALAVAAAVCCVIAFWDKIEAACGCVKEKLCKSGCCRCGSEYDDYVDWDAE
ncbi:MAG: hypothetical protein ACI4O3_02665 [Oscillospiraceae bacterium]